MISLQPYAKLYLQKSMKILLWNEKKMHFTFLQATYSLCSISDDDTVTSIQDSGQQSSKFVI